MSEHELTEPRKVRKYKATPPDYHVKVNFPYPRFVKPYSYYQTHLNYSYDPLLSPMVLNDGSLQIDEVTVWSKHNSLRAMEDSIPTLILDAYDAFNETVDAGSLTLGAYMSMWRMTARTDLLRAQPFELPEHCVFTDQLFVANCLARCESIRFADCPLYCYRLGRDGQTVAPESRIAHYSEMEKVVLTEIAVFEGVEQEEARRAMLGTIATHYSTHLKLLVMLPRSIDNYRKIRGFERLLRRDAPELYEAAGRVRKLTRMLRKSRYVVYWPLTMLDLKQRKYWEV